MPSAGSSAILKISFVEELLTSSNAEYKSVRCYIWKRETGQVWIFTCNIRLPINNFRSERNRELFFTLSIYRLVQKLKASSKWRSLHNPAFVIFPQWKFRAQKPLHVFGIPNCIYPPPAPIFQNSSPRTNSPFPPNSMMLPMVLGMDIFLDSPKECLFWIQPTISYI